MSLGERFGPYDLDPVSMAKRLLGQRFVRIVDGERLAGMIVEVEAYLGREDKAAHTFGGRRTPRNEAMYLPGGHLYVYFTYGMHDCMNVVCGEEGVGVAVLIRALEPTEGLARMFRNRPAARSEYDLCSGPAKTCQAFEIDRRMNGVDLRTSNVVTIERMRRRTLPRSRIGVSPRIGVAYAGEWASRPLRFFIRGNRHVSGPGRP